MNRLLRFGSRGPLRPYRPVKRRPGPDYFSLRPANMPARMPSLCPAGSARSCAGALLEAADLAARVPTGPGALPNLTYEFWLPSRPSPSPGPKGGAARAVRRQAGASARTELCRLRVITFAVGRAEGEGEGWRPPGRPMRAGRARLLRSRSAADGYLRRSGWGGWPRETAQPAAESPRRRDRPTRTRGGALTEGGRPPVDAADGLPEAAKHFKKSALDDICADLGFRRMD
jgi:hypothetical protein